MQPTTIYNADTRDPTIATRYYYDKPAVTESNGQETAGDGGLTESVLQILPTLRWNTQGFNLRL